MALVKTQKNTLKNLKLQQFSCKHCSYQSVCHCYRIALHNTQ